jgi:hypothetical protein
MLREAAVADREVQLDEDIQEDTLVQQAALERRLLHAVETYKASCLAAGEEPTTEDGWLVLLAALGHEKTL